MIYSILPIFEPQEPVDYVEMNYNGCDILAVMTEHGYKIERLYSTNVENYLDDKLYPGTVLENGLINRIVQ
ncbi:MAG: hypothetical protein BEN19_04920 [Epulopiscium sp. Nuni2H_MBin003]|nr:MAG: hypothetical protein BEN19_04920 [Epulopiscium sp. Nuni2H_MBin003]